MLAECRGHGIAMVFAFIDGKKYMIDYARRAGIVTVDMSVDLSVPENTNTPHDGHPSALAHQHYAETLTAVLREVLGERAARP
jgi:hypothetical protein